MNILAVETQLKNIMKYKFENFLNRKNKSDSLKLSIGSMTMVTNVLKTLGCTVNEEHEFEFDNGEIWGFCVTPQGDKITMMVDGYYGEIKLFRES